MEGQCWEAIFSAAARRGVQYAYMGMKHGGWSTGFHRSKHPGGTGRASGVAAAREVCADGGGGGPPLLSQEVFEM